MLTDLTTERQTPLNPTSNTNKQVSADLLHWLRISLMNEHTINADNPSNREHSTFETTTTQAESKEHALP